MTDYCTYPACKCIVSTSSTQPEPVCPKGLEPAPMLPIPEITYREQVFGTIKHLPKREHLPQEYQSDWHSDAQPYCRAVSTWFYKGCERLPNGNGIEVNGVKFVARPGVDTAKALRAIGAALKSFEPKHEHKIGGAGWLLSQWFEVKT